MGNFDNVPPGGRTSLCNSYVEKSALFACDWVCACLCALIRAETGNDLSCSDVAKKKGLGRGLGWNGRTSSKGKGGRVEDSTGR